MTEDNAVLDEQFPPMSDTELDALVASLPEPSAEDWKRYDALVARLMQINKEVGVFQDVVIESAPEECAVARDGKYLNTSYGFGSIGHRSDSSNH
jgi:hypothetical protein